MADIPTVRLADHSWLDVTRDGEVISARNWRGQGAHALRQRLNKDGYPIVTLTISGKKKDVPVHKLVAEKFLPPKPTPLHQIRHLNGVRADNRADNLAWGTAQENMNDRTLHGNTVWGERCHTSKLTPELVVEIRGVSPKVPHTSVARRYGVTPEQISNVRRNKSWRNIL